MSESRAFNFPEKFASGVPRYEGQARITGGSSASGKPRDPRTRLFEADKRTKSQAVKQPNHSALDACARYAACAAQVYWQ